LVDGPISFSWAMSSRFRSLHVRWSTAATAPSYVEAYPVPIDWTKTPKFAFTAVFPCPNRSYDTPTRGTTLFQFGRSFTSGKLRSGTNRPAGAVCPGRNELK
jgi:hypothetical protein